MPKKKEFFIKGKQEITDSTAPVISDEFIDKREEGEYRGQTIEVHSDTKLEEDKGEGSVIVMRAFEFRTNPEILKPGARFPSSQEIFNAYMRGIAGKLWSDGLTPETEVEPRLIFSKDRRTFIIMVWARPQKGQLSLERELLEHAKTLSQIAKNETRSDTNQVQRVLPVSPAKEKKAKRTAKASK